MEKEEEESKNENIAGPGPTQTGKEQLHPDPLCGAQLRYLHLCSPAIIRVSFKKKRKERVSQYYPPPSLRKKRKT